MSPRVIHYCWFGNGSRMAGIVGKAFSASALTVLYGLLFETFLGAGMRFLRCAY